MNIQIKEVLTKSDLKKWVEFPNGLYKHNPNFVPFLTTDEINTFTKNKNPSYDFCDTKLFLAFKNKKLVGRIAGLINHAYNKKWNKNAIRFTRFDFIDDYEVSSALFNKVVDWGKENNLNEIMGPIGFTDFDHEGMLVEGFDQFNMSITFYNHPYYLKHMEKLGLVKDIDWIEYKLKVPDNIDPKFEKISDFVIKRNNLQLVTYNNRKILINEAYEALRLIDEAFSGLYGTVPLTERVIDDAIKNNISLVNMDYVCSVKDKTGNIIGFGLLVPSIAKASKKSNGKLFPFGIFRLLKALHGKNDTLEMYFVGVKPEFQKLGVTGILINHILKMCIKNGIKYCETGPELETNTNVQSMWKTFDSVQHKRRRCFIKKI
ncbi:MAG: GNAT family N-acetyltransferase [Clostridia bacterium]|nr:GNAT family N-acetyltransferase [Clostridia bacterium]